MDTKQISKCCNPRCVFYRGMVDDTKEIRKCCNLRLFCRGMVCFICSFSPAQNLSGQLASVGLAQAHPDNDNNVNSFIHFILQLSYKSCKTFWTYIVVVLCVKIKHSKTLHDYRTGIASLYPELPTLFLFSHPDADEWPQWQRQFEQFQLILIFLLSVLFSNAIRWISVLWRCTSNRLATVPYLLHRRLSRQYAHFHQLMYVHIS